MRQTAWSLISLLAIIIAACRGQTMPPPEEKTVAESQKEVQAMLQQIHWFGHDAFWIDGPQIIYIDPYMLVAEEPKADVILVTHDHGDHCSPEDVARIQKDDTAIVTISAAAAKLKGDIQIVEPGDSVTVKGVDVEAAPAYNVNKFRSPGVAFHPKESGHVGFVVTLDGQRIYHAGDTDHIPEMGDLKEIDMALLPVSGTYAMTADEAVEAVGTIQPKAAIPMHVGRTPETLEHARAFKENAPVEVVILDIEKP